MSSGQRTLVTSQGSTPASSPTQEAFITIAESRIRDYVEEVRPRPDAAAISDRRRSMQAMQKPTIQTHALEFHRDFQSITTSSTFDVWRSGSTYGCTIAINAELSVPHSVRSVIPGKDSR